MLLAVAAWTPPERRARAAEDCRPARGEQTLDGALLHVPPHAKPPLPLVLAFHGAGGTGPGFAAYSGLSDTADDHVAGGYRSLDPCPAGRRTSVLEIHGTADTVVPYRGIPPDRAGAVSRYLAGWARRDGCHGTPARTRPRRGVVRVTRPGCAPGLAVEHLRLAGTDHGWPGAPPPFPHNNPSGLDSNEAVWQFFARRRLAPGSARELLASEGEPGRGWRKYVSVCDTQLRHPLHSGAKTLGEPTPHLPPFAGPGYTARNASVGDSRAARSAGYSPATAPTTTATPTPPASAAAGTAAVQPSCAA